MGVGDYMKSCGKQQWGLMIEFSAFPLMFLLIIALDYFSLIKNQSIFSLISVSVNILMLPILVLVICNLKILFDNILLVISKINKIITTIVRFWIVGILNIVSFRIAGIASAILLTNEQAGLVAGCIAVIAIGGTIQQGLLAYFAPRFSCLFQTGDFNKILRTVLLSSLSNTIVFLPLFVLCIFRGEDIFQFLNLEVSEVGVYYLASAATAQFIRLLSGNMEIFLSMTDNVNREVVLNVLSLMIFCIIVCFMSDKLQGIIFGLCAMLISRGLIAIILTVRTLRAF